MQILIIKRLDLDCGFNKIEDTMTFDNHLWDYNLLINLEQTAAWSCTDPVWVGGGGEGDPTHI